MDLVPSQLLAISFKVSFHFAQAVTTKFLSHGLGQYERHHRFANHTGGWNHRDVGKLNSRALLLFGVDIDRAQRPTQSRDWLQMTANANLFAVSDPTFQTACAIASTNKLPC